MAQSNRHMLGVEVILEDLSTHPHCEHGPTLKFERFSRGKSSGRPFYACAACRDRKDCGFFRWADEPLRPQDRPQSPALTEKTLSLLSGKCNNKIKKLAPHLRNYCKTCSKFVLENKKSKHMDHNVVSGVTDDDLQNPSRFLEPLTNSKKEAQYYFTDNAIRFIVNTIKDLGFTKVLNVGCPSINEYIINNEPNLSSFLLDVDKRYEQFYDDNHFARYNVFNHHFFRGTHGKEKYLNFVSPPSSKLIVLLDPPFGGLANVLAHAVEIITKDWKENRDDTQMVVPIFWIFPYFMEPRVTDCIPLRMLDYKVDYKNHCLFKSGRKRDSPIRIFTNIDPAKITLPENEGYRFCDSCNRYVSQANTHCSICNACTSKDGRTYVHCHECGHCVKPSYKHCNTCSQCHVDGYECGNVKDHGCHICGDLSHKRFDCPRRNSNRNKKRRRK